MTSDPQPATTVPRHVAIIMDGNGRWAARRGLPRALGHRAGQKAAKRIVAACGRAKVGVLTLFAFSSENWQRPQGEVGMLMGLLLESLEQEVKELHAERVRLRFAGDLDAFAPDLRERMRAATELTATNDGLTLVVALGYGGRWDIVNAARRVAARVARGELAAAAVDEAALREELAFTGLPDVDLLIRTGGEKRISNFLLWNLAYAELWFSDVLWPDFEPATLDEAFRWYATRDRRFGRVAEQG
jgi:undecaprenyl diphosphate synthase